jgi:hypothetical protein
MGRHHRLPVWWLIISPILIYLMVHASLQAFHIIDLVEFFFV